MTVSPLKTLCIVLLSLLLAACNSSDDFDTDTEVVDPALTTGLKSMTSDGVERTYYLLQPGDTTNVVSASAIDDPKPLIIGFHGSFGSHLSWVGPDESYGFVDEVGDAAIMVFPDADELADGQINWDLDTDLMYFEDLLAELDRIGLEYDRNRLFVVGHSSGAGLTNEVACLYGDIVRGAAISAGALLSGGSCVGSVGLIQVQGETDELVPINVGGPSNEFWIRYNGHDQATSSPAQVEPCVDYSDLDFGIEPYPVQWCQHPDGHPWQDFNSEAFWTFFKGLPLAEPTQAAPPGGGNEAGLGSADTTISFALDYPGNIAPVTGGAITLYPDDFEEGQFRSPDVFLNVEWNPNDQAPGGEVEPGTIVNYNAVPITFSVFGGELDLTKEYVLQISIYVEGGSRPIPTPGVDHKVLLPIMFVDKNTPVIIDEVLEVTPVAPFE